jgi:octaprenyl-diphosphate synthase
MGNRDVFNDVYAVVKRTQAITYTENRADEEAQKAIDALVILPESDYKNALILLAKFAVQRNY